MLHIVIAGSQAFKLLRVEPQRVVDRGGIDEIGLPSEGVELDADTTSRQGGSVRGECFILVAHCPVMVETSAVSDSPAAC